MDADQKQLNIRVMEQMKTNGTFYDLHARLLASLAEEIQNSSIDGLKPYKKLREGPEYDVAKEVALRYLKLWNMDHTVQAIEAETKGAFKLDKNEHRADYLLDLDDCDDPLAELLKDDEHAFLTELNQSVFYDNRDALRENLEARIQNVFSKK